MKNPLSTMKQFAIRTLQKKINLPMFLMPYTYSQNVPVPENLYQFTKEFKSWVYICATKNAAAVAKVPLRLYAYKSKKSQQYAVKTVKVNKETREHLYAKAHLANTLSKAVEFEEVLDHPVLDLFKQVNPFMSRYELWEQTMLWLEVTGNAYWYLASAEKNSSKSQPSQIWVLPANRMKIVPDKDNFLKGYIYENGTVRTPYEPGEILHLKYPSLDSMYYGMSPLAAVAFPVSINNRINKFEHTLFNNMARPEGTLATEQNLDDDEFERLKKDWYENYGNESKVGKTLILEKGLKYTPITFSPRELQYLQGRRWNREEICAAYGVPMSKVTTDSVNLANANAGERQYAADTVLPRTTRIEEKLNEESFIGRYGTNMFVAFDNPVPADKEFELRERTANLGSYVTSVNEERKKIGLADVEWGDIPLAAAGIAPLGSQAAAPAAGAELNALPAADPNADAVDVEEIIDDTLDDAEKMFEEILIKKWKERKRLEAVQVQGNVIPIRKQIAGGE